MRAAGPQRRCIATGEIRDRSSLLRFVVGPNDELVPDVASRLPGRGLWLTARRDILEGAIARRLFARSAHRPVAMPPGLADRVEALLVQRCSDAIGLARRAGLAVAGFEKVRDAELTGKAALLLLALDGAEGGRRKIRAFGRSLPVAIVLTSVEMGAVFGRDRVVNIAIGDGRVNDRLFAIVEKIAGFRLGALVYRGVEPAPDRSARQNGGIGSR
ncbi:MAG TPA: RNA-binding protein [Stellaceae bacterium]|nr:RNA-binding protein [Stellaceae bacterium]